MSAPTPMLTDVTPRPDAPDDGAARSQRTATSSFGAGRREGHDASAFYARFAPPTLSSDQTVARPSELLGELGTGKVFVGSGAEMTQLPDNSVALVVTSPPYFVGKEYELAVTGEQDGERGIPSTYLDYLELLREVFAECRRVLEPGGRIAVNVANLGRKPYRSLSADVIDILQNDLGLLLRGEVIWEKSEASSGSCAWGSFAKASNPVLRDMTERVIIASKGRFSRALTKSERVSAGLPHESTLANDEFVDVTRDVWRIDPESANRIGHPAPFPVELPRRLIDLYTYVGDLVVDPFSGSGTTVVAAARTGRIGIGYDTDSSYVDLAQARLATELENAEGLEELTDSLESSDPAIRQTTVAKLSAKDRQEYFQARAVADGKKVLDLAEAALAEAGFDERRRGVRHPSGALECDFVLDGIGADPWFVEVGGAFTSSRPGLQRADAVWRLLGRLQVIGVADPAGRAPLVITAALPGPGSPGDKALRAAGPGVVFDVIELYDPVGLERLRSYATDDDPRPLPGFWKPADLER